MPKPCAAFSPLTTTRSSPKTRRRRGNSATTASRPARPTTSPQSNSLMPKLSTFAFAEPVHAAFGDDRIEWHVGLLVRQPALLLHGECQPYREQLFVLRAQAGQRAIVITGTGAKAMTFAVECRQRHEHGLGYDLGRRRKRRGQALRIGRHRIAQRRKSRQRIEFGAALYIASDDALRRQIKLRQIIAQLRRDLRADGAIGYRSAFARLCPQGRSLRGDIGGASVHAAERAKIRVRMEPRRPSALTNPRGPLTRVGTICRNQGSGRDSPRGVDIGPGVSCA